MKSRSTAARRGSAGLTCLALLFASMVWGLEVPPPTDPLPETPAVEQPVQIEAIVVTAQKRSEDSQKVPVALTAVTGQTLEDRHLDTVDDLESLSPNLQIGHSRSIPTVYIRGVGGGGRQIGFETRAGVYVDGVYVGAPSAVDSLLLDLERAEVLRGPQGTLFGQNSTSGAISLSTSAPGSGAPDRLRVRYGNENARSVAVSGDIPIQGSGADPRVQLRVSGSLAQRDGFTRNLLSGDDYDDLDQKGARLRLRLAPADAFTVDLAADLSLERTHALGGEPRTNPCCTPPPPDAFEVDNNTQERDDSRNAGVSGTVRYERDGNALTSISAWRNSERNWTVDLDRSPGDFSRFDYADEADFYSQELRLDSTVPAWRLRWLAGLYLLGSEAESARFVTALSENASFPGPFGTILPGDVQTTRPRIAGRSYAVFGSVDWGLTERLSLDAGLRVTRTNKDLAFDQMAQSFSVVGARDVDNYRDDFSETSVDPALGLRYAFSPQAMSYLRYAHGSKSGGFNADVVLAPRSLPERFDEETVDSLEAGLKSDLFERRLRLNLALFIADYRDYQISQIVESGTVGVPSTTNAGKVRTWGPEVSVSAAPVAGLRVDLDAAWLHAEYRTFENGAGIGVDFSGNRAEFAPKWTVALALRYERQTPWTGGSTAYAQLGANYRGSQYAEPSNADRFFMRSRTLVNAQIGLAQVARHWQIGLFAENLLDKEYDEGFQNGTLGTLLGYRGLPRTWGLELRYAL
ncbi:MAG: TonB-dependent receptor [Panacagrimonas sp.]